MQTHASSANVKQAVPFFGVKDIERSVQYYINGLGFEMKNKWIVENKLRWCWLQKDEAAIMLQEFWKEGHHANLPSDKLGEGVSIYFICEDALSIYHDLLSRNIDASEPFVGNNMWVTHVKDPDGYNLYFESNTDVPEETKYSEWKKAE